MTGEESGMAENHSPMTGEESGVTEDHSRMTEEESGFPGKYYKWCLTTFTFTLMFAAAMIGTRLL